MCVTWNDPKYCCFKQYDVLSVPENLEHLKALMNRNRCQNRVIVFFFFINELLRAEADGMHQIHSPNSKQPFVLEETVLTSPFIDPVRISL